MASVALHGGEVQGSSQGVRHNVTEAPAAALAALRLECEHGCDVAYVVQMNSVQRLCRIRPLLLASTKLFCLPLGRRDDITEIVRLRRLGTILIFPASYLLYLFSLRQPFSLIFYASSYVSFLR